MKHAGPRALDALEPLLAELRAVPGLVERKRGVYYRESSAFLHFHEDAGGLYADLKEDGAWTRHPVDGPGQRHRLVATVKQRLGAGP